MFVRPLTKIVVSAVLAFAWQCAMSAGAPEIARDANASLQQLYASVPAAKTLGANAVAILVFPKVTKAGLGVGGQYGCSAGDVARNRAMFSGPGQHEVPGISIPA